MTVKGKLGTLRTSFHSTQAKRLLSSIRPEYHTVGQILIFFMIKEIFVHSYPDSELCSYTVGKNYGMNQNFADINPERDFQPFND